MENISFQESGARIDLWKDFCNSKRFKNHFIYFIEFTCVRRRLVLANDPGKLEAVTSLASSM